MVNKFLLPALPLFNGQFAFKATGSTEAALAYVLHHITNLGGPRGLLPQASTWKGHPHREGTTQVVNNLLF
jgi:hypothetical protein